MNAKLTGLNGRVHFIAHSSQGNEDLIGGTAEITYDCGIVDTGQRLPGPDVGEAGD